MKTYPKTNVWKGIILAGGSGTRLKPITNIISKQLLPVYNKPMIYYPLSVLMLAGIKDILIITSKDNIHHFKALLKSGKDLGIKLSYKIQKKPNGIAEAFIIGEQFIGNSNVCLILGDNVLYGQGLKSFLNNAMNRSKGATIFGYPVKDPSRFGIVEIDKKNRIKKLIEKPKKTKSNLAITGLYFYDNNVVKLTKKIKKSSRGELEITDLNILYHQKSNLNIEIFGRGFAWLDTGTYESLIDASNFIYVAEKRQGLQIACLEEIAYNNGWISNEALHKIALENHNTDYGKYLKNIVKNK
jgi:glucose-1-phosphate thymidylyltransferase